MNAITVVRKLVRWVATTLLVAALVLGCAGRLDLPMLWACIAVYSAAALALVICAMGTALAVWAMAVNRFFSSVVRIQKERGHHLITTGPYRLVRHPGYTGMFFGGLASPLAMGSWWALVPAAAYALLVLRRALIEDRFLMESLDGYKAFSAQVRHRLVPGLW